MQGLEFQTDASVIRTLGLKVPETWNWNVFGNGYYNFKMIDYGAPPAFGTDTATRMYQYEPAIGTRFGQTAIEMPWNFQVIGILRGPMWYNTEESLNPLLFPGQIRTSTVYRKEPFWVLNMRGELEVRKGFKVFAAMNNIFDVNAPSDLHRPRPHAVRRQLLNQNGACGNSMPGREVIVGAQGAVLMLLWTARILRAHEARWKRAVLWRDPVRPSPSRRRPADHRARRLRPQRHRAGAAAAHRPDLRLQRGDRGVARALPTASSASRPIPAIRARCSTGRWSAAGSASRSMPWWRCSPISSSSRRRARRRTS